MQNYTLLMAEFRRQLDELEAQADQHYLLTIAAPASPDTYANVELAGISRHLDWLNLMAYDFHGSWDKVTNCHSALYATAADPGPDSLNVHAAVQGYLAAGVPADKIMLGLPFYGRGWAGVPDVDHGLYQPSTHLPKGTWDKGFFDYKDLAKNRVHQSGYLRYWHEEAQVPWLYSPSAETFIIYDDPESLGLKADYARELGLGGVMFWELSADDGSLLDTLHTRLRRGGTVLSEPLKSPDIVAVLAEARRQGVLTATVTNSSHCAERVWQWRHQTQHLPETRVSSS